MKYKNVKEGVFLSRPNRFVAHVLIDGKEEVVHVKNTGRCRELLVPGVKIFLEEGDNSKRKTKYDLIAVYKGDVLYNIDSQAPNKVFGEYINTAFEQVKVIKPECGYKNSRFDFYVEYEDKKAFIEVKGVTLEEDNVMLFPDAPTERGVKHLKELCECVKEGYEAYAVFIIQADAGVYFTPNTERDRAFSDALKKACEEGVNIKAFRCDVKKDKLEINEEMEVRVK
ncbi:MAG: DNA/RNA nuclease SfsA [Clostridia bacterium]|nr:DNA/RNA nuclease SfsA [Clostridia bacterium]